MNQSCVPSDTESRAIERAGKYLARELREVLSDFGDLPPRLAPAVVLSALMRATPDLIDLSHADEWPGSLAEHRSWMAKALMELSADKL